ncbi:type IV pilus assembly protein FimV [Ramlibacter albus]|uniref:FimV N-terminal domain-containing protein n=1 Tax=Ramlibacter albus TaxID=2079448 RepID=A0A923MG86_9BURK|nr:hypothetical protein [Ramlibacter albus]MBC5768407.1 hypothetical protein [Ramlibacter albus]
MRAGSRAAAVLGLFITTLQAHGLELGEVRVHSALGAPLRAEIRIAAVTAAEAASLKVAVAGVETYMAAGVDYSPSLEAARVDIVQGPDGPALLRITGKSPVREEFVDLLIEATSSSGRLLRDYTLRIGKR